MVGQFVRATIGRRGARQQIAAAGDGGDETFGDPSLVKVHRPLLYGHPPFRFRDLVVEVFVGDDARIMLG